MGRKRIYAEGQRPSDYKPHKSAAFLARMAPLDNGLAELCDLQIKRPLSQRDIAQFCGVSQQLVCRIERGARRKLFAGLKAIGITRQNPRAPAGWARSPLAYL